MNSDECLSVPKKIAYLKHFIDRANKKHNYKYDYSLVSLSNLESIIDVICPNHGSFKVKAARHLVNQCIKCRDDKARNNIDDVKLRINQLHNYAYQYINFDTYKNNKQKINILCEHHGLFILKINTHLSGRGCTKCYKLKIKEKNLNSFIERSSKIHNHEYDYSKLNIKNYHSNCKIPIICNKHGKFKQIAWQHVKGSKCPKCIKENRRLSLQEFLSKAVQVHGDKYNYDDVNFTFVSDKINIKCYKHGIFSQRVGPHLYAKHGCPNCSKIISKAETEWLNYIKLPEEYRNKKIIINNKVFFPDGFDPNTNTLYEYYGDYWHGNLQVYKPNKINKMNKMTFAELNKITLEREKFIKDNGYHIVSIWESDWNKLKKESFYEQKNSC